MTAAKPPIGTFQKTASQPRTKPFNAATDIRSWPTHQSASLPPLTPEAVELFFEQERKTNSKSSTVGAYFRRIVSTSKPNTGPKIFRQLGRKMKESFGSFGRSSDLLEMPEQPTLSRPQDPDWVFFRGFGGKSPTDIAETNPIYDVPRPQAPPRRKKELRTSFRRTVSLTDIVLTSGAEISVEPVYDFPRSTPIYAVVNKAAKIRNRNKGSDKTTMDTNTGGSEMKEFPLIENTVVVESQIEANNCEEKFSEGVEHENKDIVADANVNVDVVDGGLMPLIESASVGVNEISPPEEDSNNCDADVIDIDTCSNGVASFQRQRTSVVEDLTKVERHDDDDDNNNDEVPASSCSGNNNDQPERKRASEETDQKSSTSRHAPSNPCLSEAGQCTDAQDTDWKFAQAAEAAAREPAASDLQSQVAPMPLSTILVEECVGSKFSDEISKHGSEQKLDECENENLFLASTSYHAEVYSESDKGNRMFDQQSDVNQGKRERKILFPSDYFFFQKSNLAQPQLLLQQTRRGKNEAVAWLV